MSITEVSFKEMIRNKALESGFLEMKAAQYRVLEDESRYYTEWLEMGFNATMNWMERNVEKKRDIRLTAEFANTVIVFAHSYFTGNIHPQNLNSGRGKISRYAWGTDYHDVVLDKLKSIEEYIKEISPGTKTKSYVDTGPILEKQWAVISGLGWQGKNSLVLNKEFGSYFFLGVIITDLELESDPIADDYCRNCRKCIDACPTGAIIADKIIDSNKCISYWTIEAKPDNEIPPNIAEKAEGWIFGCDICQEVCPWNKNKPVNTDENLFRARFNEGVLERSVIEQMDNSEFSDLFRKSPVKRLKLKGLQRNARNILERI